MTGQNRSTGGSGVRFEVQIGVFGRVGPETLYPLVEGAGILAVAGQFREFPAVHAEAENIGSLVAFGGNPVRIGAEVTGATEVVKLALCKLPKGVGLPVDCPGGKGEGGRPLGCDVLSERDHGHVSPRAFALVKGGRFRA